jgi:hypothetical protein
MRNSDGRAGTRRNWGVWERPVSRCKLCSGEHGLHPHVAVGSGVFLSLSASFSTLWGLFPPPFDAFLPLCEVFLVEPEMECKSWRLKKPRVTTTY